MELHKKVDYAQFITDGTFEGMLTAIFDCYAFKVTPSNIVAEVKYQPGLFGRVEFVITDKGKAKRVADKLKRIDVAFFKMLYCLFLSEYLHRELLIYRLISKLLRNPTQVKGDFRDPDVLHAKEIKKEIAREVHRMHAFVRFQRMADDIWFAAISPDFDVIPLIGDHFEKRYADQKWVIYDVMRGYGLHYDLRDAYFVEMDLPKKITPQKLEKAMLHPEEEVYQQLWKDYFKAVNIELRGNMKLHVKNVPRRYWRYLFEKQE